ncbi:MAG: UTP--glucose-1-phosphate uridylyltransferase [Deltaproteobacteria bacterium]|nr:UTP--glucose-1-phosphate uridylyltransferase [Deltaproteobacteria bacterium]
MEPLAFDVRTQSLLDVFRFDRDRFEAQRALLKKTPFSPALAHIQGALKPIERDRYLHVDSTQKDAGKWKKRGEEAIKNGEVAFLLLNGGMATRFGGIAKGAATAFNERSFLALRMRQAKDTAKKLSARITCVLMNSFATDEATKEHLREHKNFGFPAEDVLTCVQGISLRLTENGELFKDDTGQASMYTPGHGDLPWTLAVSGVADKLHKRGVKTLFVSNVDNLGCSLDPLVLGAHLCAGKPLSVETIQKLGKDVGGAPVYVDGKLQLVEGFRFPPGYDQQQNEGFNTNTFYFDWPALDPKIALGFYPVAKKVDGRTAVQFERIVGEVTAHVKTTFLRVPRDDEFGRFLPVKAPEDLVALQPVLAKRYQ